MDENRKNNSNTEMIKPIFEKRFKEMLGEEYDEFIEYIKKPQRKSFRINTLKVEDPNSLIKKIEEKGFELEPVLWCKNAYFVKFEETARTDLGNLFEHFLGEIYIQEATSMLPPLALEIPNAIPQNFTLLDMAASPGSKTSQVGEMMKNNGVIVANELDFSRLGALKANLERTGIRNIIINNEDGARISGYEIYDRVLLDAPCSGSGVIRKSPKTLKTYNPKRLKGMQNLQLKLLKRAFELLKKGGIMTYSTCSLDPEENELCIMKFLNEVQDAKLEKIEISGIQRKRTLNSFEGIEIPSQISEKVLRVWPNHYDSNGFFLAKIRKE